ncbi:hypothetical protein NDU88_001229 [Pleurodeles waltl]|uniref:Uncharacterized protein n=1 Tax=Pleurodeles waltl TaxID=8319 RepID=A0AAV7UTP7_PLEWA|nr:hypothetical protein NDU88_001229 [Pleurodeles waltl]
MVPISISVSSDQKGHYIGASSIDATRRCPGGTSTDARSPGDTSGATFVAPEALYTTPRIAETPDDAGLFKARENEERKTAPQEQKKTDEPTATWEEENSALALQPRRRPGNQEAAQR